MRRAALVLLALVTGALLPAGAIAQTPEDGVEGPALKAAGAERWPDRAFRLTLPERRKLSAADLQVTENGEPVEALALDAADGAGSGAFGSVLVIDASASMRRGDAIGGAMAAARDLAAQRQGAQRIGVVVFNERAQVLVEPTADQAAIDGALARAPRLAPQTHIFDAVVTALDLLQTAKVTAGSIVVLSDGADTGSRATPADVAKRARASNVLVSTVGLRSGAFDPAELKDLAAAGRGRYTAATSTADLRRIFRRIGAELASEFLLTYRSTVPPGGAVIVAARLVGTEDVAVASYSAPGGERYVEVDDTFWTSDAGVWVTAGTVAMLLLFALIVLFARRLRPRTLQQRVRSFVTDDDVRGRDLSELFVPTLEGPRNLLERSGSWSRLVREMEIARIDLRPATLVLGSVAGGIVLAAALVLISDLPAIGIFGLAVPFAARQYVRVMLDRQRKRFTEQLPEILQGAASAVRAGSGLVAALAMVAENAPEPARTELTQVVADEALGVPLDQALQVVEERMASRDVLQIALVAQIQRDSGGNIAEVLDRITEALRQRGELRRMVSALTAQGRLSRWVVSALPIALLLAIAVLSPDYVRPLFEEPLGIAMLLGALTCIGIGSAVIGKIVNFEV